MLHSLETQGFGVRLRPAALADCAFIAELRNLPHTKGNIGDTPPAENEQVDWMHEYFQRANDYYFIIENRQGQSIGTVGIYNVDNYIAEWGRWIIQPAYTIAALGSALLVHEIAFGHLGLQTLTSCVVSTNKKVLNFHKRFGAEISNCEKNARKISGAFVDLIWIQVSVDSWPSIKHKFFSAAEAATQALEQQPTELML